MRRHPLFEGDSGPVEPDHRVVGGEPELIRNLVDGRAVNDHPPKDRRVLGLQLLRLYEHAPAIDAVILDAAQLELVDRKERHASAAKLVDENVAHNAADPLLGSTGIAKLVRALKRALKCHLQDVLRIDARTASSTDEREKLFALGPERASDRSPGYSLISRCFHDLVSTLRLAGSNPNPIASSSANLTVTGSKPYSCRGGVRSSRTLRQEYGGSSR